MKVILTYFKVSGKYYSTGEYDAKDGQEMFQIWDAVRKLKDNGALPGLVDGAKNYIISIDVPDHPYNHPHLIL